LKVGEYMPDHPSDPRADKVSDHKHWKNVLHNAWHLNKDLYGVLHGVRCGGAEIVQTANSFMLVPGDWSPEEWDDVKLRYLAPHKEQLISLFKLTRFALYTDEALPEGIFSEEAG